MSPYSYEEEKTVEEKISGGEKKIIFTGTDNSNIENNSGQVKKITF